MQPQNPTPPPANNYDFIMNPAAPPRKKLFGGGGGNSLAFRALVIVAGLFVLAIVAGLFIKLLNSSGGGFDKAVMLGIAQDQSEIIRVSTAGSQDAVSQSTKNFAYTVNLSTNSDQSAFLSFAADHGLKPKAKQLSLKQNGQTDTQLDEAKSSSTYDTAFTAVMKQNLQTYQRDLGLAFNKSGPKTKAILKTDYEHAVLLLAQLNQ